MPAIFNRNYFSVSYVYVFMKAENCKHKKDMWASS